MDATSDDRPVTEFDLRADKWRHPSVKVEDLERDSDGDIVRKDRFVTTCWAVARALGNHSRRIVLKDIERKAIHAGAAVDTLEDATARMHAEVARLQNELAATEQGRTGALKNERLEGVMFAISMIANAAAEHGYTPADDNDKDA